jgi:hypothetical protein
MVGVLLYVLYRDQLFVLTGMFLYAASGILRLGAAFLWTTQVAY